jgi:hypothetical protein
MDLTIFLAQALGLILTVSGLAVLINLKDSSELLDELIKNKGVLWLGGYLALFIGAVVIALNNVWNLHFQLLLTIVGWAALLKGALILLFPKFTMSFYKKWNKPGVLAFGGLVALILGLILLYKGYM